MILKQFGKALLLLLLSLMSVSSQNITELKVGEYLNRKIKFGESQYFYLNATTYKLGGPEGIINIETEDSKAYIYAKLINYTGENITESLMPMNENESNFKAKDMFKGMQKVFPLRMSHFDNFNCTSCFLLINVKFDDVFNHTDIPLFVHYLDSTNATNLTDEFAPEEIFAKPGEMVLRRIYLTDAAKFSNYYINFLSQNPGTVLSMLSKGAKIPYNFEYLAGHSEGFYNYYFIEEADFEVMGKDTPTFTLLIFGDGNTFKISGRSIKYDLNNYVPVMNEVTVEEAFKYHHFALKGSEVRRAIESLYLLSAKFYIGSGRFLVKYSNSSWEADITKELEAMNETNSFNFTSEYMPIKFAENDTTNHILVKSICDEDCVFDIKLREYDGKLDYDTREIVYLNSNSTKNYDYDRTILPNDVTYFVKVISGEGSLRLSDNTTVALTPGLDFKGLLSASNDTFSLNKYPMFSSSEKEELIVLFNYKYSVDSLLGDEPCIDMDSTNGIKMYSDKDFCAYKKIGQRSGSHVKDILVDYFGYFLNNEFYYKYDILVHDNNSSKSFTTELDDHSFYSRGTVNYWKALRDNHDSKIDVPSMLLNRNYNGNVYVILKPLKSNKLSFNLYPQYTEINLSDLHSDKTNTETLTMYKLNKQEVSLTVNKELIEKFVKVDINKCFGDFSYELAHSENRREVFTKNGLSLLFNISELQDEISDIKFTVKPENITENYFSNNTSLNNRTDVVVGYRYFNTQNVSSLSFTLKNETVLYNNINGNKIEFNFQPYTENINNFTVEYHLYVFNGTDFSQPNICQLMNMPSTFQVDAQNLTNSANAGFSSFSTHMNDGDYVVILAAKESRHLNILLPYQPVQINVKNFSSHGHTGMIIAIVLILSVMVGVAAFLYFKRMKNKTGDENRVPINSDKLLP